MNARGFTLLEVLVALAILGVAVVASIQGFAQGLRLLKLAGDHQDAMMVADQKLRELVDLSEGTEEGTETRFQWKRTVARVPTPELVSATRAPAWTVYQIDVHVQWDEKREVHLATLRTLPTNRTTTGTPPTTPGQITPAPQPTAPAPTPTPPGLTMPRIPPGRR